MSRRIAVVLFALALPIGAGVGVYTWFWSSPAPEEVEPPKPPDAAGPLPPAEEFAKLAQTDPVAMLEKGLARCEREVRGFRAVLLKQERMDGVLHEPERVRVAVRNDPLAVSMVWEEGARKDRVGVKTAAILYPDPKAPDKIKAFRPESFVSFTREMSIGPKDSDARRASRFCVRETGFDKSMLRTYDAWKKAKERGDPTPEYLGVQHPEKLGGRACHVVRRHCRTTEADSFALDEARPTDPEKLAKDGFDEVTVMIDAERWLQVGTELRKKNGDLVAAYYFRDLELNPEFGPDAFTVAAVKPR